MTVSRLKGPVNGNLRPVASQPIALLVDAASERVSLEKFFRGQGWSVESVQGDPASFERVNRREFDLLVLAQGKRQRFGLKLLETLRKGSTEGKMLPVVLLLESPSPEDTLRALQLGADEVFERPVPMELFAAKTKRLLDLHRHVEGLHEQIEALHRLSVTDGLTQVFNHRYFQSRLKEEFRRAQRYEENLALMLVDLDHFKNVNDRFGHQAGDLVLREVALAIKANIRDTDVVARYGGEEFVVLLPKTQRPGALTVAERVWSGVASVKAGPQRTHPVTLSIGVSSYPGEDVDTPESLLQTADEALYTAKRTGRNRIVLHEPTTSLPGRVVSHF